MHPPYRRRTSIFPPRGRAVGYFGISVAAKASQYDAMTQPPEISIDLAEFAADPYPTYARLRRDAPIAFVPELGAVLMTRRAHIAEYEKRVDLFSSVQPDGLMTLLMGENMMRKDGPPHLAERKAMFPTISPRTARDHWMGAFRDRAQVLIAELQPRGSADILKDFAMPMAGEALKLMTGLTHVAASDIDRWSQAMIDGIANYAGDPAVETACHRATAEIDAAVATAPGDDPLSLIETQKAAGMAATQVALNVRLAISGGQNETRDAMTGLLWALLAHPEQLDMLSRGSRSFHDAFDEYVRWMAPIGMSPRRIARDCTIDGIDLNAGGRMFFMFAAANRDETVWPDAEVFDITRDASRHIGFGAGPHFCAGAPAAKTLIADVAVPLLLAGLPGLSLAGPVDFHGWAFRGPAALPVVWRA